MINDETRHKLTAEDRSKGGKTSKRNGINELIRKELDKLVDLNKNEKIETNELLIKKLLEMALKENIQVIKELFDRAYGKSKSSVDLEMDENATRYLVNHIGNGREKGNEGS